MTKQNNSQNLPLLAYSELSDGRTILVKKGEKGFYPISEDMNPMEKSVKELNAEIGVTEKQALILKIQSMN